MTDGKRPLTRLFTDAPERGELRFEFEGFAQLLADLALNPANETPFTIVVQGDWGRGKTTLMRRAQAILDAQGAGGDGVRQVRTLWLNAWKYPQEDNILAGLLGELITRIHDSGSRDELKLRLVREMDWMVRTGLRPLVAKVLGGAKVEDRYDAVEGKRAFYDSFQDLFGSLSALWFDAKAIGPGHVRDPNDVVAVFLDDLDRCRRERVLEALEAVNLFHDQPGTCFFLGVNHERLHEILLGANVGDPERVLEKIVQVAFDLPDVSVEGVRAFVEAKVAGSPLEALLAGHLETVAHVLDEGQRHPRHVKRFLNDLSVRIGLLRATGDLGDGAEQVTGSIILSWHLLHESVPRAGWRKAFGNPGNLDSTLRALLATTAASAAEGKEIESLRRSIEPTGLLDHARAIQALNPVQKNLLIHHGSPPERQSPAKSVAPGIVAAVGSFPSDWWVRIPAGTFAMGSEKGGADEKPVHRVTLGEFHISRFPVTNAQYAPYVREAQVDAPRHWEGGVVPDGQEDHPVTYVSWHDATAFCAWLSKRLDMPIALPTEAQWEFAARGAEGREYPWGSYEPTPELANFGRNVGDTTPVTAYPKGATPEGVHDMAGNVWEWCADGKRKYEATPVTDPRGPEGTGRVLRGGSFDDVARPLRAACRGYIGPDFEYVSVGFRCGWTPPAG